MTLEGIDRVLRRLEARTAEAATPASAVSGQRSSAAIARHAAGLTSTQDLVLELEALGYSGPRAELLVKSAILDRHRRLAELLADIAIAELRANLITPSILVARLRDLGFSEDVAALQARLEELRLPEAPKRRTTLGLILPIPPEAQVLDAARRRTSIGVQLVISPTATVQDLRLRRTSIGLVLELAGAVVGEAPAKRTSSIGLVLELAGAVVGEAPAKRTSSIGLVLELAGAEVQDAAAKRRSTIGLLLGGLQAAEVV